MRNRTRLLAAGLAVVAFAAPALAHTYLTDATPAPGAHVATSPAELVMHFTGALEPTFSSIVVTDEKEHVVDAGPSVADGTTMRVPLKPLVAGHYEVTWRAVSIDTHMSEGKYDFVVGP